MVKKTKYFFILFFFIAACADTFSSVKRGLTGAKGNSADEFLVQKKDPLILPPDFENLPTPENSGIQPDANLIFEKTLEPTDEDNLNASSTTESSILRKIKSK